VSKAKPTATIPTDEAVIAEAIAEGQKMIEAGKAKIDTALAMYEKLEGMEQDIVVKAFIKGATLTEKGALTYWYNCRRRIAKERRSKPR
jgi:phage major head subunit gpT-like protein